MPPIPCLLSRGIRYTDSFYSEMIHLQERVDDLEQLLRQISVVGHGDSATQLAVQKVLQNVSYGALRARCLRHSILTHRDRHLRY